MIRQTKVPFRLAAVVFFLAAGLSRTCLAVGPLDIFQGLVAGDGEAGNRDGAFDEAQFNRPMGLALSPDGTTLYVADSGNNLVRAVFLNRGNEVQALAVTQRDGGSGAVPYVFDRPTLLAALPGGRLAVFEEGRSTIGVVDLAAKTISLIPSGKPAPPAKGPAPPALLTGVWDMAYFPADQDLYFSQPGQGLLRRIDLDRERIETLLDRDPRLPNPAALCAVRNRLYVANAGVTGTILSLQVGHRASGSKPLDGFSLQTAGVGRSLTALAGGDEFLYGLEADADHPLVQFLPANMAVSLASPWGEIFDRKTGACPLFDGPMAPGGLIADSAYPHRFYLSNPSGNFIASVKDVGQSYAFLPGTDEKTQTEFDYPARKPPHTFRILIVGRSYVFTTLSRLPPPVHVVFNRMESIPKRLEFFLNTAASLDDLPTRFEVFNSGLIMRESLYLWPYYVVPDLVKKYDIDLVLLLMDPGIYMSDYFESPMTSQGIPSFQFDPEYLLKPYPQRIPPGVPRKFFDLCRANKLVETTSNNEIQVRTFDELLKNPDVTDCLVEMVGKPLDLLNQKLRAMRTSRGVPPRLELCFFTTGDEISFPLQRNRDFWRRLCREKGLDLWDMTDIFTAQRLALYPFSELGGGDHFDVNGDLWMAYVLAHGLIKRNLVPWVSTGPLQADGKPK